MKKVISIFVILLFASSFAFSQDEIFFNSGDRVNAKVMEISKNQVKYKKFSNLDGPLVIVNKKDVKKIIYQNGEEDVFTSNTPELGFNQNIFAYNIFDVVYSQFAFSYEHISKSGKMSFFIPISIGYGDGEGPKSFYDQGFTGFGINLFPTGQHRVTYYLGPEIHVGIGEDYTQSDYDPYYGCYLESTLSQFVYGRLMINNGIAYSPVPNLRLNATFGLGIRYYDLPNSYDTGVNSTAYFTISMGYAF
jgi:hypothetical protein